MALKWKAKISRRKTVHRGILLKWKWKWYRTTFLKFRYCEKATKIWKNLPFKLRNFKKSGRFFSNCLAFSQCLNFTEERNCLVWLAIVDIFLAVKRTRKEGEKIGFSCQKFWVVHKGRKHFFLYFLRPLPPYMHFFYTYLSSPISFFSSVKFRYCEKAKSLQQSHTFFEIT